MNVFAEPWEAQAFALAVSLQDRGVISAAEWAEALGAEIAAAPDADYYACWLAALVSAGRFVRLSDDFLAIPAQLPGGRLLIMEGLSPGFCRLGCFSSLWLNQYTGVLAIPCSSIVPVPVCLSNFLCW